MAHEYTLVLEYLVQLLDHQNHGIYIHIDQKASALEKKKDKGFAIPCKKSRIYFLSRYKSVLGDKQYRQGTACYVGTVRQRSV